LSSPCNSENPVESFSKVVYRNKSPVKKFKLTKLELAHIYGEYGTVIDSD
jgi:hypothetical protein